MANFTRDPGSLPAKPGINITEEDQSATEIRVVKLETGAGPQVKTFSFNQLKQAGKGDYQVNKSKFGALAATDEDRHSRTPKDSRFSINPLLRDPLAVEIEERRVIEERVNERVDALREQAHVEGSARGYEVGLKQGHDEAFQEFRIQAQERMQSLDALIANFEGLKTELLKSNERFILETIFQIGKMITLKELSTDRDFVLRLCKELIDHVGVRDNIRIHVSPEDMQSLEMIRTELPKMLGELKNLHVDVSDKIELGGCRVETQWNAIDASVETQLKGIYEALMQDTSSKSGVTTAATDVKVAADDRDVKDSKNSAPSDSGESAT